ALHHVRRGDRAGAARAARPGRLGPEGGCVRVRARRRARLATQPPGGGHRRGRGGPLRAPAAHLLRPTPAEAPQRLPGLPSSPRPLTIRSVAARPFGDRERTFCDRSEPGWWAATVGDGVVAPVATGRRRGR